MASARCRVRTLIRDDALRFMHAIRNRLMLGSGLVVALCTVVGATVSSPVFNSFGVSSAQQAPKRGINRLANKTGWIILGDLSKDKKRWASAVDPNVDYFSGTFEIVDRAVDRHTTTLPKVGERIRVMVRMPIVILDYRYKGEQRALEPPSSVTRPKGPYNDTGLFLEPGSIVRVQDVQVSRPLGQLRVAWARVSPGE